MRIFVIFKEKKKDIMIEKRLFEGQTYDYVALPTFIPGTTQGTTFIFRKEWKKENHQF